MAAETGVVGRPQWYFYLRNDPFRRLADGWYRYDPDLNRNVEQLYQNYRTTNSKSDVDKTSSSMNVVVGSNNFEYEISFSEMTQRNTATFSKRPIERSVDGSPPQGVPESLPPIPRVHVPSTPCILASMAVAALHNSSSSSTRKPALTPVPLTELLRINDKTLWKLKLQKLDQIEDMDQFCEALKKNYTVTSVQVSWKFLRRCRDPSLLLENLGSLTNLSEMSLEVLGHNYLLSCALRNASKLKSLRIGKLRFTSNQEIQELAVALEGCQSLQQISLAAVDDAQGLLVFPDQQNRQNETMDNGDDNNETKIRLDPLLDAMTNLPQLEHIRLKHHLNGNSVEPPKEQCLRNLCRSPRQSLIFNSCGLTDPQCMVIADELKNKNKKSSTSLSVLVVTRNFPITPRGWDAFIDMLQVNYKIVDFHQGEEGQRNAPSPDQNVKIRYYLGLNQAGRGKLLCGSMTSRREAWFDFLVRGRNDLDQVFFALQVDPSLYITTELIG